MAHRAGCATRPTGPTGDRARWRPTTTRSRRPSSTSAAGCDAYVDAAFRMQARCTAPSRTLVGNWVHGWPHDSNPGPNLDELHEVVRFFDRWLKDERNGARRRAGGRLVRARLLRAGAVPRRVARSLAGGLGVPASGGGEARVAVRRRGAAARRGCWSTTRRRCRRRRRLVSTTGRPSGRGPRCRGAPAACPNGLARDLRPDEALGPTYTTRSARSADLDPRRARGHPPPGGLGAGRDRGRPPARRGPGRHLIPGDGRHPQPDPSPIDEHPEPLVPGRVEEIRMPLRPVGYRFVPGHRIRVSVASSYWPVIWPSPYPGDVRAPSRAGDAVRAWSCRSSRPPADRATLPVPAVQDDAARRSSRSAARARRTRRPGGSTEDVIAGTVTVTIHDGGEDVLDDGRRLYAAETLTTDRLGRGSGVSADLDADVVYRWHEIAHRDRDPRAQPSRPATPTPSTCRSTSRSTSTASAFFRAVVARADPAPVWSERRRRLRAMSRPASRPRPPASPNRSSAR